MLQRHQYIERESQEIRTEKLISDGLVNFIYSRVRESAPALFKAFTSARYSALAGYLNYDRPLLPNANRFMAKLGVEPAECIDAPSNPRQVFQRKIRYWDCRPMPADPGCVVSPADAKLLIGSLEEMSALFLKDKLFTFDELLGRDKTRWLEEFENGDFAVFRLTPDKYHYNHVPVAGRILDFYEISGLYHSCNPGAVVAEVTPYSKNRRMVTIIDTDVKGGTQAGRVAMIEVVALMIGHIVQCYSDSRYDDPRPMEKGLFMKRGQPKSLYCPGSSTDVLLFQKDRIRFDQDLLTNRIRTHVDSRFSRGFGQPLVETDVRVRSSIARIITLQEENEKHQESI